jgi:uncharacterized membrane protein YecN with MAPEG domain
LLGLLAVALTVRVIMGRTRFVVAAGDGGNAMLAQAIRAHANFAEQVPLSMLLIGFGEACGVAKPIVNGLGILLVVARLLSAFGLSQSLADTLPRRAGARADDCNACRGIGADLLADGGLRLRVVLVIGGIACSLAPRGVTLPA